MPTGGHAARQVGLARALSKLGICSRSQAVDRIREGRVRVNGLQRRNPEWPVRLGKDRIELDAQRIDVRERVYLMLNKPRGLVTSAADEKGRATVYSVLPPDLPWLAPVGRLDKASEGLLLLTNDSEWGQRLLDPASHLDRTYHVQIGVVANANLCAALEAGVVVQGERLRTKRVRQLRAGAVNSWIEVILDEGRNRHIRRMLAACGIEVLRLVRVAIGSLQLEDLAKGAYRHLTTEEKRALDKSLPRTRP